MCRICISQRDAIERKPFSWQGRADKLFWVCHKQTNIIFIFINYGTPCTRKFQSFEEETLWLKLPWQCCFKQLEEEVLVVSFNIDIVASIINSKPLWSHIWIFTNLILSEGIRKADTLYLSFVFLSKSTFSFSSGNKMFQFSI